MDTMAAHEKATIEAIDGRVRSLRRWMLAADQPTPSSPITDWFKYLEAMNTIQGNINNDYNRIR